jgi:NhaP-type Na+/H+ or K+/H+ antiporter
LIAFLICVLLFRRLPIVLALYKWIPGIRTFREALFCGHFGPMGLGGVFLAIEARAILENGTATPDSHPPRYGRPYTARERAVEIVWPLVCFIVFGSTLVHGLSVLVMSLYSHLTRPKDHRSRLLGAETDPLEGMDHDGGDGGSVASIESEDEGNAPQLP